MLNNGKPYRDKDEILTSKSDSFKRERESSLKNEPENTDCLLKVANDSCIKDIAIVSPSKYKNDSKNLDIHKSKESMENERKINGNEKWWVFYFTKSNTLYNMLFFKHRNYVIF